MVSNRPYIAKKTGHAGLDKLHTTYCRWKLGVNKRSNVAQTLRECRINPTQTEINRAQASYLLTTLTRDDKHLTTAALEHIWTAPTSRMYKQWLTPTLANIHRWKHPSLADPEIVRPNNETFRTNFPDYKTARRLNTWVKRQCREDLEHNLRGHDQPRGPSTGPPSVNTNPTLCRNALRAYNQPTGGNASNLLGHKHNVQTNNTSILQTTLLAQLHIKREDQQTKPIRPSITPGLPYASTPLPKTNLQLIERHRLRTTNHNAYKFLRRDESTDSLACPFCSIHGNTILEDVYHVCLECPLYTIPRQTLLDKLAQAAQDGPLENYEEITVDDSPYKLLARILTPINATETKATIRFLRDSAELRKLATDTTALNNLNNDRVRSLFLTTLQTAPPLQHQTTREPHPLLATRLPPLTKLTDIISAELASRVQPQALMQAPALPQNRPRRRPGRIIAYL